MDVEFDTTKKYAPRLLGKVAVLGIGKSGRAVSWYCAELLGSRVESLTVYAGASSEEGQAFAKQLTDRGARVLFDTEDVQGQYDVCIASPGISQNSAFYQAACASSDEVISEVEFAWRESDKEAVWIAVTGTNGKTTTTSLTTHILQACGKRVCAVGNIGDTCLEAVSKGDYDYYVAETSSYQLASTRYFKPQVAILLNITPDHLKWHGSFDAYKQAKQNIYANCDAASTVILDATNEVVRSCIREFRHDGSREFRYIPIGSSQGVQSSMIAVCGSENAAYLSETYSLCVELAGSAYEVLDVADLQIKGEHNVSNALAAASAALSLHCECDDIARGLQTFAPLEHRIEPCGFVSGAECFNDSKATNVDATLKALSAFGDKKPYVLLGGDDKGTPLDELVAQADQHCSGVVCFGEAGPRFVQAFAAAHIPVYSAQHLEDALDVALDHAQAGDVVVLSPACASFDEFNSFEHRGKVFKEFVAQRSREQGV